MRASLVLIAVAAASACQRAPSGNLTDNASTINEATQNGGGASAALPTDCTLGMTSEIDEDSFRSEGGKQISKQQLTTFRPDAEKAFKTVATKLCASGEIPTDNVAAFHRLVIQNGSGANATAIYGDDTEGGPRDRLVFQYLFDDGEGHLLAPPADDIREGLLCWFGDEQKYKKMCEEREP